MNDKGIAFPVLHKAMQLIRRGTDDLNVRDISGVAIVLENDDFVIEIKPKKGRTMTNENVSSILLGEDGKPHHLLGVGYGEVNGKNYVSLTFHQIPEGRKYKYGEKWDGKGKPEMFFSIAFGSVKSVDGMIAKLEQVKELMLEQENE